MRAAAAPMRLVAAAAALWIPLGAVLLGRALWQDRLPAELPTHWGPAGPADAASPAGSVLSGVLVASGAAALVGTIALCLPLPGRWAKRGVAAVAGAVAGMAAGMWIASAGASLDASDPYTVGLGAWAMVTMFAVAYGVVPMLLAPKPPAPPVALSPVGGERASSGEPGGAGASGGTAASGAARDPLGELSPTAVASWSRTLHSPMFLWVALGVVVLGGATLGMPIAQHGWDAVSWPVLVVYALTTLLVVAFVAFRVTVDWRGLRVTSLLLRVPVKRIPPERIAEVSAIDLRPGEWGGWGYRVMPGRSAIVLRSGPALAVTLTDNRQFAVTIDDPAAPASILTALQQNARRAEEANDAGA